MAKEKIRTILSPEQELHIRDFLDGAAELGTPLPSAVVIEFLNLMGYKVLAPGKIVRRDREIKTIFGDPDPFRNIEDEYGPDGEALRESLVSDEDVQASVLEDEVGPGNNVPSGDTDEASSGESSESDEVGDVLQQDV